MTLSEYLAQPNVTAVALGQRLGVSHTTVIRWAESRVPAQRLIEVARATGIPVAQLRPDLASVFQSAPQNGGAR